MALVLSMLALDDGGRGTQLLLSAVLLYNDLLLLVPFDLHSWAHPWHTEHGHFCRPGTSLPDIQASENRVQ